MPAAFVPVAGFIQVQPHSKSSDVCGCRSWLLSMRAGCRCAWGCCVSPSEGAQYERAHHCLSTSDHSRDGGRPQSPGHQRRDALPARTRAHGSRERGVVCRHHPRSALPAAPGLGGARDALYQQPGRRGAKRPCALRRHAGRELSHPYRLPGHGRKHGGRCCSLRETSGRSCPTAAS